MTKRSSAGAKMQFVSSNDIRAESMAMVRESAEPFEADDSAKAKIRRASVRLGLTYGETYRLWYGLRRVIPAELFINIKTKVIERRKHRAAHMRRELEELEERYATERAEFLQTAHPLVARLVPPGLAADEAGQEEGD